MTDREALAYHDAGHVVAAIRAGRVVTGCSIEDGEFKHRYCLSGFASMYAT
jgi:hypothetical protein